MAKIKVKAGKGAVQQAQEGGDFGEPPKAGLYHLKLAGLEQKTAQGTNGNKYLNCRWQPVGLGREGTRLEEKLGSVWDVVSFSEDSEWARARFAIALGAQPNRAGNVELDVELDASKPGSPIGTVVLGRVKGGKDLDGNYKPQIGWIGPLDAPADEDNGYEDDDEELEEEEEPFDEEEDEEEADEVLTEESLKGLDNKALGALAKDFDLDTKKFVKKVKGKSQADRKGLIAAILEAQGFEGDEGEDEDPF